ncbi:MAG: von Willebrand factor type A domain-containing protein, partial [Bacteroidota bacterium]
MKRILFLMTPMFIAMLAFGPVNLHTVSGTITDDKGNPIPSVTIQAKGKSLSALSAADGKYTISLADKNAILIFSAVGFETKEVKVKGRDKIDVSLSPVTTSLQEVIVTGYAIQSKKDITGSISVISTDRLYGNAAQNYSQPLVGKAAGLSVATDKGYYNKNADEAKEDFNTEGYDHITENRFLKVTDNPLSTFSIDVDAASYSNVRRFLNDGQLPPAGAVRIEEMINYFHYEYPQPEADKPFSINTEISDCPWNSKNKLVLIGLQGKKIPTEDLPASNLVFLIDVSGSMDMPNKLPLVKTSMKLLVDQLREQDRVAMVVYAGAAGLVLPSTSGADKTKIKDAIDRLGAGGSTAGGAGIKLAYKIAKENFAKEGNNRVILCTDGDFNIGASSDDDMERLIEQER